MKNQKDLGYVNTVPGEISPVDVLLLDRNGYSLTTDITDYTIFEGRSVWREADTANWTNEQLVDRASHQMTVTQVLWSQRLLFSALYRDHEVAVEDFAAHAAILRNPPSTIALNSTELAKCRVDYITSLKKHVTQTRAKMIFALLEDTIMHAVIAFEARNEGNPHLLDPETGIIKKVFKNFPKGILPTEADFLAIPEEMLLRRFVYLWTLVYYLCPLREMEDSEERFVSSFSGIED